jgi:hypothetical protein
MSKVKAVPVTPGSGNVFADIGLPNAAERLVCAKQRAARIYYPELVWRDGLNRTIVADAAGLRYYIADRSPAYVVSVARRGGGRLSREQRLPRVIGVTRSLRAAKDLCKRHCGKDHDPAY